MCKPFGVLSRGLVLAAALLFGPVSEASERVVVGVTGTPNALAACAVVLGHFSRFLQQGYNGSPGIVHDDIAFHLTLWHRRERDNRRRFLACIVGQFAILFGLPALLISETPFAYPSARLIRFTL